MFKTKNHSSQFSRVVAHLSTHWAHTDLTSEIYDEFRWIAVDMAVIKSNSDSSIYCEYFLAKKLYLTAKFVVAYHIKKTIS